VVAPSSGAVLLLGLESARSTSATVDLAWRYSERWSFNAFASQEDIRQVLNGNAGTSYAAASSTTAPADWQVQMRDKVRTFGLGVKASELVGGKVELSSDYVRVSGSSPYLASATSGFAFSTTATAPTTTLAGNAFANGGVAIPVNHSNTDTIKLGLRYRFDKTQSVRVMYAYQRMSSADAMLYTGLQPGTPTAQVVGSATSQVNGTVNPATSVYTVSALLPTYEQAPNYAVQAIGIAYVYTFN
jgi:predicted porin